MIDADISRRLGGISKEQLFENFSAQLSEMQTQQDALQSELSARDATISQLRQQVAALQQQSQMNQTMSERLIQSARHEAQGIINDANAKAQAVIQQAQGTSADANRQAQETIRRAQAKAAEITDTQTRLLRSQIDMLKSQKTQAAAEAERCLKGIVSACDAFTNDTNGYNSDLQALRESAESAIKSIQTERFVQSSIGDAPLRDMPMDAQRGMSSSVVTMGRDASQANDMFSQSSPIDALLNATEQRGDDGGNGIAADVTAKMMPRNQQEQIVIPVSDDDVDNDFVFDPNDTISPDDAKSFTSEFNLGDLVHDDSGDTNQSGSSSPSDDIDDGYDDDDDYDVSADDDLADEDARPKPRQRKQPPSKGQWF